MKALKANMGLDVEGASTAIRPRCGRATTRAASNLSTATSSGKSLVYNLPVMEAVLKEPSSTAFFLFPTKALAQDQHEPPTHFAGAMVHRTE